jgi:hypothetical protein
MECMAVEVVLPTKKTFNWQFWRNFKISRRKRLIMGSVGVLLIALSVVLAWLWWRPAAKPVAIVQPAPTATPTPTPVPKDHPDPLNGVLYTADEAAAWANRRPLAVMVENHVLARPQSGLQSAEVLYEAMAEGGITRFMALYLAGQSEKIGPVRSARLHFVSWAAEYDAAYAHWGGSAEALSYLRSHSRPLNIDEFSFAKAFWRDYSGGKPLEHTGYSAVSRLRQVIDQLHQEKATDFTAWTFKDEAAETERPASQTVRLGFLGTAGYAAEFDYRPATNDYVRLTGGKPHVDADGQQLLTKSIVLLYQRVRPYTDTSGHAAVDVQTVGSGQAVVIEDGQAAEGQWHKDSINSRTVISDAAGQPLALDRGKIWVISVPVGSSVSY